MGPLFGLLSLISGLWFLLGMPLVAAIFARKYYRSKKLPTGLLVSVVMLVVFYLSAQLIWSSMAAGWDLSFLTTIAAAGDAEKYGHPVEHRAEVMLAGLLLLSTFIAAAAGAVMAVAEYLWTRLHRTAA